MLTKNKKAKKAPRKGLLERRDRILEAAAEVFAEKGFEGATIDDIAARAGVGKGTIYRRVGKKEDFLTLLLKETASLIIDSLKSAISKRSDPIFQFKEIINTLGDIFEARAKHFMILFQLVMQTNQNKIDFDDILPKHKEIDQIIQLIENVLQRAIKNKQIRPVDTHVIALGLFGFFDPPHYQHLRHVCNYTKSEIVQMTIDLFLNGLKPRK
ncbi:MAG: TetR/AcrR family transcriptional regulator [Planctomycetota bacterium]